MKQRHIFEGLLALYVTTLIVSNIASVKLVGTGSLIFDAGTILFPLAYILGDIITEIYGFKKMRTIIIIGILMLILTSFTFWIVGLLPPAADWSAQSAYNDILGVVWRIVAASIVAILLGELINSYVLASMKVRSKGKNLWQRIIGSSVAGNAVDTTVFSIIAFAGVLPFSALLTLIATVFVIKMLTEIAVSPLTMKTITHIKKLEQVDTFETPSLRS